MTGLHRVLVTVSLAGMLVFGASAPASADHDESYFYGWGYTQEQATAAARASLADHEQRQSIDCVEEYVYHEWNWEYEWWEAILVADCTPGDTIRDAYFHGAGSTDAEAIADARAEMADYERQQGVDCAEQSAWAEWNWEYEFWEGHVTALCDFG